MTRLHQRSPLNWRFIQGVALIHLLLACVAFMKDVMFASYFGTNAVADALALAFFIPDTIGNNLIAATLAVACVPIFSSLYGKGNEGNDPSDSFERCIHQVLSQTVLIVCVICFVLYLFSSTTVSFIVDGMQSDVVALCIRLLWIMIPIMLFFPLTMVGNAALHASGSFYIPALAPVVFNSVLFVAVGGIAILDIPTQTGAYLISLSMTIAAIIMTIFVFISLYQKGIRPSLKFHNDKKLKKSMKQIYLVLFPYFMILLFTHLVYFVERYIAAGLSEGTLSALTYAFRLSQFPNWVFVAAITAVILPTMTHAHKAKDFTQISKTLLMALGSALLVTLIAAFVLWIAREPIVSLLFMRGAFDSRSLEITTNILAGYSWAIVGQAITAVAIRYWTVVGKLGLPVFVGFISAAITVGFDVAFVSVLGESVLGWGAAAGATVNAILLWTLLVIHLKKTKIKWLEEIAC